MKIALLGVCAAMIGCGDDNMIGPEDMSMSMSVADLAMTVDLATAKCESGPITGFTPTWRPPTATHQNRCTSTQITSGVTALFGGAFNAFKSVNADCAACMVTNSTDAMRGPLVQFPSGLVDGNRDGCLAHRTGDASASSCAAKVQAMYDCGLVACPCPIRNADDIAALNECADPTFEPGGVCESYATAAKCSDTAFTDAGTPPDECFLGSQSAQVWFTYLVTLFCGA